MGENNNKVNNFNININSNNHSNNNNSFNDTDNSVDRGVHVDTGLKKKKYKILNKLIIGILITVIGTVLAHIIITGEMPKTFEDIRRLFCTPTPAVTTTPTSAPTPEPTPEPAPEPAKEPAPELAKESAPEPAQEFVPEPAKEPTPEPTPTPAPVTPNSKPAVPVLSNTYTGKSAHLELLSDETQRRFPRLGPDTSYVRYTYGYRPKTVYGITAFFEESGYLFCDVRSGAEERYVFLHKNFFDDKGNVPQITSLPYYTGTTTGAADPRWGPSNGFNVVKDYTASAGTSLRIFFQENGFVYAEYSCSKGLVRMWLPADKVNCSDAVITK